jgi:hypothetical protein
MEDVIVERTTVRSTTQNPKPKPNGGGVYISGENITVGTIIVNSPGARVDNSTNTYTQMNQQNNAVGSGSSGTYGPNSTQALGIRNDEPAYHADRDFFKGMDGVAKKLLPTFIMSTVVR